MRGRALLLIVAGLAVCAGAAAAARTSPLAPAGHVTALHALAGVAFIAVGVFAWSRPQSARVGALMCAVGFAWFIPDLGYLSSSFAVTLALLEGTLAYAFLGHLFVAFPSGYLRTRLDSSVVLIAYLWIVFGNLVPDTLFAPPEIACGCAQNLFVLHRDAAAHTVAVNMHQIGNMVVAIAAFGVVVKHWLEATPPARRALAPVVWASGPTELAIISLNVVGVVGSLDWLKSVTPTLTPIALMTLPFGFLAGLLARVARGSVGHLILDLGQSTAQGHLRDALAEALGDPSLSVAYWRPDAREWVDLEGRRAVLPDADGRRVVTFVERGGEPMAALVHDSSLETDPWLLDAVCAAASLALDNERLRADVAAQLEEVRASRSRIVDAADAARRRLERDLHDGAQQRLVSVLLTLRLAHQTSNDSEALRVVIDEAIAGQENALAELRELASGIHPAVLTEGGLGPALRVLAELAPVPVTLSGVPGERLPQPVEAAAYFVVAEALANVGKHARAQKVSIEVTHQDGRVCVLVADDGVGGADISKGSGLRGLADRVAAVDGHVVVVSPRDGGTRILATIPCA